MTFRLGILMTLLSFFLSLSAQTEVLVEFASAKTLGRAKEDVHSTLQRANGESFSPVWYTLQSTGERTIAIVKSIRSLEDWKATPGVIQVQQSTELSQRTRTPNDPTFPDQWDMEQIEISAAWEYTTGGTSYTGREIVVGVIEFKGFQIDHPDLEENFFINQAEIPNDGVDNDNNGLIDDVRGWNFRNGQNTFIRDSHATKVCGTLAAKGDNGIQAVGTNWDLKMVPLEVSTIEQWVAALDYLTTLRKLYNQSNGAEGAYVVAANMSLGASNSATCDPILNDAFDRAGEEGILCVGATSNNLEDLDRTPDLSSDCASEYLIIVTASDRQDDIWGACGYSTTDVDIAAPGETYRTVEYISSGNANDEFKDTSGATPHVAGAVALAYAIDCPTLDEISLIDPAGAALIVKDAILSTGDEAIGNAALTTSGKRLNVRRAIERLLVQDCLVGDMIVQLEAGQAAPSTLSTTAGELNLIRPLSDKWNIHLYNTSGGTLENHVTQLEAESNIVAAEPNIRMILRGRQPNDPGYALQDNLDVIGADDAWTSIYGNSSTPPSSRVVTAIFDQNFDLNSQDLAGRIFINENEIATNGIDDDGNGYIDDNIGFNLTTRSNSFSAGNHGFAVASIIAANADDGFGIAGIDWSGKVLPLQGNSLAQWIEGASYVAELRNLYNRTQGNDGALIASYVTPQGGKLFRQGGALLPNLLDSLLSSGILAIGATVNGEGSVQNDFPTSIQHPGLLNTAYGFIGGFDEDLRSFSESNKPLYFPADNTPYALTAVDTLRLHGSSASAAIAAGSIALLYQAPCLDLESQAYHTPMATANRLRRSLYKAVQSETGYRNDLVKLSLAAQQSIGTCPQASSECKVISLSPNPIRSEGSLKVELVAGSDKSECPVSIYDPLGRVVFRQNLSIPDGYLEIELSAIGSGLGLYFLTAGETKDAQTLRFVRSE